MAKKKRPLEAEAGAGASKAGDVEPRDDLVNGGPRDEPKKRNGKKKRRESAGGGESRESPTVSIAVAGSIIDNTQSYELATRLAGQIARAATIFRIDEVVVFDNKNCPGEDPTERTVDCSDEDESGAAFLIRILRYLETPQYLRKTLFPKRNSLRFVGLLPPLDAPHHLRRHEWAPYREGVTLKARAPNSSQTLVDVGLNKDVVINQALEPGIRVTVVMGAERDLDADLPRQVVSSSKPRDDAGTYWGYKVRYASNLSSVIKECPYEGGYDYAIGTSEHGEIVRSSELIIPASRHFLIAFGGLAGLEESVEEDNSLKGKRVRDLFNRYLNTCPHQGSRTIRTEEAILISLQYFQEPISRALEVGQLN
ncbi:putative methyltransferase C9orf114 isoform X2 [Rhodamnia argentea]|uniref:Methyltransferase C9orf114 isoform X2 n=1 Tax=Rhodamnia argentea TaxID=178133 RepID=A0A8B8QM61_9MYRT|nr:putative methyltransferase C9orf114 isoform X2 [Rhodamnia argentea]